jgi:predicted CXXCH cytochrome family protein
MPQRVRHAALALALALAPASRAAAKGGAFPSTRHGDPLSGVLRLPDEPRGDCAHCHSMHASSGGAPSGGPYPFALFAPDDDQLCATCHATGGPAGSFQGMTAYRQSSHATSASTVWPGPTPPARSGADAGKCVVCHDPHGTRDAAGVLPALTFAREEALCDACHDGSPAARNVAVLATTRPYRHPVGTSGRHRADEGGDPAAFGAAPADNRHAECADCHDPHVARADPTPPAAPDASARLLGVSRVKVTNGGPGTAPVYTFAPATDPTVAREYEVCFKCHSSFTAQPAGQSDLALLLNPQNRSFHPVEERGRNAGVRAGAFVSGWTWDRLVRCGDCHASDDAGVRGPHGSTYRYILPAPYAAVPGPQAMGPGDLCFRCHSFDTYANPNASQTQASQSRFNPPGVSEGHGFHVGDRRYTCYACHQSHGSAQNPALVVIGRTPGLRAYAQTPTGGSCTPSCHSQKTYSVAYPR